MNRRALLIAFAVGALGLVLLLLYQQKFESAASGGEKVKLLIAVKRIERGKPIADDMVSLREVPIAYVDERAIRGTDKNKILGLRIGNTVKEQQMLLWTDLTTGSDDRKDLSALVSPGSRAISIRVSRDESSVALVRPGDYVDVIGVLGGGAASPEKSSATVLLQRVLVLAVGNDTSPNSVEQRGSSNNPIENMLTLSLSLGEAQILSLAADRGKLTVAVRNPDDQQKPAVSDIDSVVEAKKKVEVTTRPQGPTKIPNFGAPQ
ncbi:MAG: Flp pilus assembly protein CpaB [Polyangiaceae bacterium]|nr:Flp pilus assembly protein CpaB [Polyangiaceae bacterium]